MELITRSDDERLGYVEDHARAEWGPGGWLDDCILFRDSLRAALTAKEKAEARIAANQRGIRTELQHEKDSMQPYFASIRKLEKENGQLVATVKTLKEDLGRYMMANNTYADTLAKYRKVVEAGKPFAHDDLCKQLGGNCEGDASPIFQRNHATITLGDCRKLRATLKEVEGK